MDPLNRPWGGGFQEAGARPGRIIMFDPSFSPGTCVSIETLEHRRLLSALVASVAPVSPSPGHGAGVRLDANAAADQAALASPFLPPHARVLGRTLQQWIVRRWQKMGAIPARINPLLRTDSTYTAAGDDGSVFYPVNKFSNYSRPAVPVTRRQSVRDNQYIFLSLMSNIYVEPKVPRPPGYDHAKEVREYRAVLANAASKIDELHLTIDGVEVPSSELFRHHEISPEFDIILPSGNMFHTKSGKTEFVVTDGYWLMLKPLSAGQHTIHFHGAFHGIYNDYAPDVTYRFTSRHV
jgi:hypothetical protein